MKRRHFLNSGVGLAGAVMLPGCGGAAGADGATVLVVGAGVAGLTAARDLVAAGHNVTVLEARPTRYGGRLWTDTSLGVPLDLGASWIHGVRNNPIKALANRMGATMATTSYDSGVLYGSDGAETTDEALGLDKLDDVLEDAVAAGQAVDMDEALFRTLWDGSGAKGKSGPDQALIRFLMSRNYETEYGASVSGVWQAGKRSLSPGMQEMSTHWFDDGKDRLKISGADEVFAKGYGQVAEYLAKGLDIRLGERVREIDYSGAQVKVTTTGASYTADKVVVTVPLGVLKKAGEITFTPALPDSHRHAIERIGMGVLNKLYLKFDEPFWDTDVDWIESVPPATEKTQTWTEWVNFKKALGANVIMGFSAADAGVQQEALSDEALVASAMARLRLIYGADIPEKPSAYVRTRWQSDPFTYGSYSFNALGVTPNTRKDLAKPVAGKLFFAGEATDPDYFGTVHGAYLSGQAAAALVTAA